VTGIMAAGAFTIAKNGKAQFNPLLAKVSQ
jgi:hypothetical protein